MEAGHADLGAIARGEEPFLGHGSSAGPPKDEEAKQLRASIAAAIYVSLVANVCLLLAKLAAFVASGSMSVLASLVDSVIDLVSQALVSWADAKMGSKDARYPAGKGRLEPVSVLGCAFVMSLGAAGVVQESAAQLAGGLRGQLPELDTSAVMYGIMGGATALKAVLWVYCYALRKHSGAALALAEDHMNDVASNVGAIATASVASHWRAGLWWVDPAGGILISVFIAIRWVVITRRQVQKIVGRAADEAFLRLLSDLAAAHDARCTVGYLRAYHAGQRLAVDIELEGPAGMTIAEGALVARGLKAKVELLPEVEAALVVVVHTMLRSPSQATTLPCFPFKPPTLSAEASATYEDSWANGVAAAQQGGAAGEPSVEAGLRQPLLSGQGAAAGGSGRAPEARERRVSRAVSVPLLDRLAWWRSLLDAPQDLRSASIDAPGTGSAAVAAAARRRAGAGPPCGADR